MSARHALAAAGIGLLALLWFGPLPVLARSSFAAHMAMHMGVVAIAAPLLAAAVADTWLDPARRWPHGWMAAPWWALLASVVSSGLWLALGWTVAWLLRAPLPTVLPATVAFCVSSCIGRLRIVESATLIVSTCLSASSVQPVSS